MFLVFRQNRGMSYSYYTNKYCSFLYTTAPPVGSAAQWYVNCVTLQYIAFSVLILLLPRCPIPPLSALSGQYQSVGDTIETPKILPCPIFMQSTGGEFSADLTSPSTSVLLYFSVSLPWSHGFVRHPLHSVTGDTDSAVCACIPRFWCSEVAHVSYE